MFTDKETREKREATCQQCPSKNGKFCGECGCFLMLLKKVKTATCPLKKW